MCPSACPAPFEPALNKPSCSHTITPRTATVFDSSPLRASYVSNYSMPRLLAILLLSFSLYVPSLSHADQEILLFGSEIILEKNADLTVTETMTLRLRKEIKRKGLSRNLPFTFPSRAGKPRELNYDIIMAFRDNNPLPLNILDVPPVRKLKLWKEDDQLGDGDYTYTVQYHVSNAIDGNDQEDSLLYSVTGEWQIPLNSVEAVVKLPEKLNPNSLKSAAYIVHMGGFPNNLLATTPLSGDDTVPNAVSSDGKLVFRPGRVIKPGEMFVLELVWPKGFTNKL